MVNQVQVCVGCDYRFVGPARIDGEIVKCSCGSDQGWCCCASHSDKCDLPMCEKTEKWLASR